MVLCIINQMVIIIKKQLRIQYTKYVYVYLIIFKTEQSQNNHHHQQQQHNNGERLYTGSSTPGRSFRLLQAMTMPENAGKFSTSIK